MPGGSGEPPVTNSDLLIPGYGPDTLLLAFRQSFSSEQECGKPTAVRPNNLTKQKEGLQPIVKLRFVLSSSLLDGLQELPD